MFQLSIKPAIRNILRNRITSLISIIGLGIGLGCIIVLVALTIHEKSFDKFIPEYKNVYRIIYGTAASTQYPLAENMINDFPEVRDFFRYYQAGTLQMRSPANEIVRISNFSFADASIFKILGISFKEGGPAKTTGEIAISEETAKKYFGNRDPIGNVLHVKFTNEFTGLIVSGIYNDLPSNSTINPLFIADIKLSDKMFQQFQRSLGAFGNENRSTLDWNRTDFTSYVVLDPKADPEDLAPKLDKYRDLIVNDKKDELSFRLQPVSEIYLGSGSLGGDFYSRKGNPDELVYYKGIAFLIFIISLANYVLLSRAGVDDRKHELGTRKVFGASRAKIISLIFTESFIIVILSLIPASFMIDYGMDFVNDTLNKTMTSQVFLAPRIVLTIAAIVAVTGTLSGWLIGLRYSRIPALSLIQGKPAGMNNYGRWNYSFLILHFAIFIILVSGVSAITKQIKYSLTEFNGVNPDNVLVADLNSDELKKNFTAICNEISKIPGVEKTAGGTFIPPFGNFLPVNLATVEGDKVRLDGLIMGEGMTDLLEIKVIEGESFGPFKQGTTEIMVNESAAKKYNIKAGENFLAFMVRGIVKDFHAHSLHTSIQPMVILQQNPARMGLVAIKTTGANDTEIIKKLRDLFTEISPDEIFEVRYLSQEVENFYQRERNQARVIGAFSILATILSVMGLFGISLISISRRTKEIGIRKVNGSMASDILLMLNLDFVKWIFVSILISIPVSVYLISIWIKRFAYKTDISWWIFAAASISAILVAILTVSWQSWRAATRNPVEALKYE